MTTVSIDDLAAGMTLARDVCGKQGRMLFPAGTVLEAKALRIMRIWGVTEVEIAAPADDAGASVPDEAAAPDPATVAMVEARFRLNDTAHPAVAAGFGCNGSSVLPPLGPSVWALLGPAPGVLPVALSQARRQIGDIVTSLLAA